jgi:plasmid stabilization system protein ParE
VKIEFLAVAEQEFEEAVRHYNQQKAGLGDDFATEVKRALERILQFPQAWSPLSKRARRCRTKKFPYGIIYQIRSDKILVVAVMHFHRDPKSWKSRI